MCRALCCVALVCLVVANAESVNRFGAPRISIVRNLTEDVDTRIGTAGELWGIGELNPGPQMPFGCLRLGPDTSDGLEPLRLRRHSIAGYFYPSPYIECFSHTHVVGAGEGDFQNFGVMVTRRWDDNVFRNSNYKSAYSHNEEVALPGYYAVNLGDANTYAELSVSGTHSGMHRYTCRSQKPSPSASPCVLVIDLCHSMQSNAFVQGSSCVKAQVMDLRSPDGGKSFELRGYVLNNGSFSSSRSLPGFNIFMFAVIHAFDSDGASLPLEHGMWENERRLEHDDFNATTSHSLGIAFTHPQLTDSMVIFEVRVGISFVSSQDAEQNLVAEQQLPPFSKNWLSFEQVVAKSVEEWEKVLSRMTIAGGVAKSKDHRKVFLTALYHAHLTPTVYSENSGKYIDMNGKVKQVPNGTHYYSDFSIWDTYRTQAPLMVFTMPDVARDTATSMVNMFKDTHELPVWVLANLELHCMVGHHSAIVLADYLLKGIGGFDNASAFSSIVSGIREQNIKELAQYQYVPFERSWEGASLTLDYALDAGAVANAALLFGNKEVAEEFQKFAKMYANVFHPSKNLFCPKYQNGTTFCPPLLLPYPLEQRYTEGNAEMYRWYVPHDIRGLVSLYPSPKVFAQLLDEFFQLSFLWPFNNTLPNWSFWAGNEPVLLTPLQFNFAGNEYAHLTQSWMPVILDQYYYPYPAGIPGNDDYGTMSAWLVFCYVGIFPIASTDEYALFSPRFDQVNVSISYDQFAASPWRAKLSPYPSGRTSIIVMRAWNRPATGVAYLANVSVNGVPLRSPICRHKDLLGGPLQQPTIIDFYLSGEPSVFGAELPSRGGPQPFFPHALSEKDRAAAMEQLASFEMDKYLSRMRSEV